jgi:hypothetical protein
MCAFHCPPGADRWRPYSQGVERGVPCGFCRRTGVFDRTLTPEQIMDRLEERVGPEGRKLFEKFIRQVNVLQAKQQLEAQAQRGVTERPGERGPV